jgi:selenocysteine lyase/cysteine desulfurase
MDTSRDGFRALADLVRRNEIGGRSAIETPFGKRSLFYADLTASGRYLEFIESWLETIRPFYANTHTTISSTGKVFTDLREQARDVVRHAVHAGPDDEVVFVGSGATAAVNKLVGLLGLRISEPLERAYGLSRHIPDEERPVVFLGPYEHHSNELPWLESIARVVEIDLDARGAIDLDDLRDKLAQFATHPLKIGTFSAASNVTGLLTDVAVVARLLHAHGAYAFFDYAAAAPYLPIDMHPADPEARLDAIFLSMHKFMGGPGASGVLVAHRELFRSRTPERPGGGTVDYVAGAGHDIVDYVHLLSEREEGGTPAILGDLRAGAAFLLKEVLGPDAIREEELHISAHALRRLQAHPRIDVLGPVDLPRLAILSFNIRGLHHDLISILLDHLFGIQNRSGCSCAGPYGHRLLGIDLEGSHRFRALIQEGILGMKPGWVRLSVPYYAGEEDVEYLLEAVEFLADHGEDFVPLYELDWRDGVWRHGTTPACDNQPLQLTREALETHMRGTGHARPTAVSDEGKIRQERRGYLEAARLLAAQLRERWSRSDPAWNVSTGRADIDDLVWFRYVRTRGLP